MSTLVLAMALCSVPGNAPDGISAEAEQPLRMPGTWAGATTVGEARWSCEVSRGGLTLTVSAKNVLVYEPFRLVDEGRGRFHLEAHSGTVWPGIYRWKGGRVLLGLAPADRERPTSFQASNGLYLFTLRRVK